MAWVLLFFHKGISAEGVRGITSTFSRLDHYVYLTTVVEDGDDLGEIRGLGLRCSTMTTVLCEHRWSAPFQDNVFTMWFDLARIQNRNDFESLPLAGEVLLDGATVLRKEAVLRMNLNYGRLVMGGKQTWRRDQ